MSTLLTPADASRTLETLYNVSGIIYPSNRTLAPSDQSQARSQIDARSIQNRWTSPINYFINTSSGFTPSMLVASTVNHPCSFLMSISPFSTVRAAIANWQTNTCLTFNQLLIITGATNKSYISLQRDDNYGCSSPVGYDPTDPTCVIFLAQGCGDVSDAFVLSRHTCACSPSP